MFKGTSASLEAQMGGQRQTFVVSLTDKYGKKQTVTTSAHSETEAKSNARANYPGCTIHFATPKYTRI